MKFISLIMTYREEMAHFDFGQFSVIWSANNRSGKSTLLRCLLYSIGYPIPSTRGLDFSKITFQVKVEDAKGIVHEYKRMGARIERVGQNDFERGSQLGLDEVIAELTGIENKLVLENLLGVFYLDQDRGWTLLNRGKAIGGIRFSIEDFVSGLTGRQCEEERRKLVAVEAQKRKYLQVLSVARYQEQVIGSCEADLSETSSEVVQKKIRRCQNLRAPLVEELHRLQCVIRENNNFKKFFTSFSIIVRAPSGEEFPVTEEAIVGFRDNQKLLKAKRQEILIQIGELDRQISIYRDKERDAGLLVDVETDIQRFDAQVSRISIDIEAVERVLAQLSRECDRLNQIIKRAILSHGEVVAFIERTIFSYLKEFGVSDLNASDLFSKDLKSLGGTGLHLVVFAFRLAYVKTIRDQLGCVLPIIIDSPHGREVRQEVVEKMMSVLLRDFKQHQIIMATIYDPHINNQTTIALANGVFGNGPLFSFPIADE